LWYGVLLIPYRLSWAALRVNLLLVLPLTLSARGRQGWAQNRPVLPAIATATFFLVARVHHAAATSVPAAVLVLLSLAGLLLLLRFVWPQLLSEALQLLE
jgi:hypothetical protein